MEPTTISALADEIGRLHRNVGIGGAVLLVVIILSWIFLRSSVQSIAEEASQRSLRRFQSMLDKEVFSYQTAHQKQIDAIHATFQKFQAMIAVLGHLHRSEPFTPPMKPGDELARLVNARHEFKQVYSENKILFAYDLCERIESLIASVDKFIKEYDSGLFDLSDEGIEMNAALNRGVYIAGLWSTDSIPEMRKEIAEIAENIERQFREVYQTGKSST